MISFKEALNILNLNYGYNEENLKTAYKNKSKIWHPDLGRDPSGEMMKKINMARDILMAYLVSKGNKVDFELSLSKIQLIYVFQSLKKMRSMKYCLTK